MRNRTALLLLLMAGALLCQTPDARAFGVRSREASGVIQTMDSTNHMLTFKPDKSETALVFKWTRQTRFVQNLEIKGADALKQGSRVRVYYRSPFFGKPIITKVVMVKDS